MEINKYFVRMLQSIKTLDGIDFFMGKAKLSQTEFRLILEVILEREKGRDIISSELARRLGITRSAVSQIVTKLEERDIVKRVASPTDRKIAYVQLSDSAISIFNEQLSHLNQVMDSVLQEYGEERLQSLLQEYDEFAKAFRRCCGKNAETKRN